MARIFHNLLLLGRPASGKSEFIDFMNHVPEADRARKYGIGKLQELDDFPWIWQKFMEDNLWEAAGYPRRYSSGGSNPGLCHEGAPLFDFCMAKFNHEYHQHYANNATFGNDSTLFIEFARGGARAYAKALAQLDPAILDRAVILFILVSYEESCHRNNARYQEKLQHSILAHKVPDDTMQIFYQTHDWLELTGGREGGTIPIGTKQVPFVTMPNEPELTDPVLLDVRYGKALQRLMELSDGNS